MSHFSVLVVTNEEPTEDVIVKAMQPYHEFECTGYDDEYVKDIDITERIRDEWHTGTSTRVQIGDDLFEYNDPMFYREPTEAELATYDDLRGFEPRISYDTRDWGDGKGRRPKIRELPASAKDVEVTYDKVMSLQDFFIYELGKRAMVGPGEDPAAYGEEAKYGYFVTDEHGTIVKAIDRTNPNAEWDWYVVGGRFGNKFVSRAANGDETCGDICQRKALSFATMKAKAVNSRNNWIDKICGEVELTREELEIALQQNVECLAAWDELTEETREEMSRDDITAWKHASWPLAAKLQRLWDVPTLKAGQTIQQYIDEAPALTSFAVVKDGKWYEKGKMGWWSSVKDEKDDWENQFDALLESIPGECWLANVDCHI